MSCVNNNNNNNKPHAVCVPFPAQGHINPMLKLAKLLHQRGFYITFVHTEYNLRRLLKSRGPEAVNGLPGFRFEAIPDGLPPSAEADVTQDIPSLVDSTTKTCLEPFRRLLSSLNDSKDNPNDAVPPVSCVVSDSAMTFTVEAGEELGVPVALLWTASACGFMAYMHFPDLIQKGLIPLKDESYLKNGYLDTVIDWIPGLNDIQMKELPSFLRTTDPNDIMLNLTRLVHAASSRASAVILNTFDSLERDVVGGLSSMFPRVLAAGPLHRLVEKTPRNGDLLSSVESNLWREESECLQWLDSRENGSVVYVNFGSITVMSPQQLREFAWGLANSMEPFVWIIRPDLVVGDSAVLPPDFVEMTRERGVMAGWCAQERVLSHPAVGGFLTHCGWNSTLESLSAGVPVVCWPFFAEQQTNCRFLRREWGVGMEIDSDVRRESVERQVRELMEGERGKEMRNKALEWKRKAEEATDPGGSSSVSLDNLIKEVLLQQKK